MIEGQIVYSKCGRDKGQPFVIVSVKDDFVYLVNGGSRPLGKPKKKKGKHVQPTLTIVDVHTDADICKEVKRCQRTMS